METLKLPIVTLHVLSMVGAFGALWLAALGLPSAARADGEVMRRVSRWLNALISVGLLTGAAAYMSLVAPYHHSQLAVPGSINHAVAAKFVLFLAVGACIGIASAKARKGAPATARALHLAALILLAAAAYLGLGLHM